MSIIFYCLAKLHEFNYTLYKLFTSIAWICDTLIRCVRWEKKNIFHKFINK